MSEDCSIPKCPFTAPDGTIIGEFGFATANGFYLTTKYATDKKGNFVVRERTRETLGECETFIEVGCRWPQPPKTRDFQPLFSISITGLIGYSDTPLGIWKVSLCVGKKLLILFIFILRNVNGYSKQLVACCVNITDVTVTDISSGKK